MATARENLMKIFSHERPDWIPVVASFDRDVVPEDCAVSADECAEKENFSDVVSRRLGLDIISCCPAPYTSAAGVEVESFRDGAAETKVYHTPSGDLRETVMDSVGEDGSVRYRRVLEHMVKGTGDLEALAALFRSWTVKPDPEKIDNIRTRREVLGGGGILRTAVPGTPLGLMYRCLSGVETLAYLWVDARDELMSAFEEIERYCLMCIRAAAAYSELDALTAVDDTSTRCVSPEMFEACNVELTDARARTAHEYGKLYFHHSCGHIRGMLPLYRRTGMDAVHEFTVPPLGDVTVGEGRVLLGKKITIMANIDKLSGREGMRASIRRMVREAAPWDHFIIDLGKVDAATAVELKTLVRECRDECES